MPIHGFNEQTKIFTVQPSRHRLQFPNATTVRDTELRASRACGPNWGGMDKWSKKLMPTESDEKTINTTNQTLPYVSIDTD